jgi:2-oxoisovalerate dehydrogenase E2 component (dihydrolipoyl transacylase)
MSVFVVRLPDVGEGVAEAELVAWHVAVGDAVTRDTTIAEVLTDKATVEIYAPVDGVIAALHGTAGDVLAVGSEFIAIETDEPAPGPPTEILTVDVVPEPDATEPDATEPDRLLLRELTEQPAEAQRATVGGAIAAPAVRDRARRLGIDLGVVDGSGPDGRVNHEDLDRHMQGSPPTSTNTLSSTTRGEKDATGTTEIPLIGLRRKIAERMTTASSRIPHITYVEEVDMTRLEELRHALTAEYPRQTRLTVLPFVMCALVHALSDHRNVNATFDDETQVLKTYDAVHVGIATQTNNGLLVPVVRNVNATDVWRNANEMERVTSSARTGTARREDLTGSTITITSLGAVGGLVTTPIINYPEVAIVGINKMQTRPVWSGTEFVPRTMMNVSSSFDHRIIDGWEAAMFIQRVKVLLEEPSLLFIARPTANTDGPAAR